MSVSYNLPLPRDLLACSLNFIRMYKPGWAENLILKKRTEKFSSLLSHIRLSRPHVAVGGSLAAGEDGLLTFLC